MTENVLDITDNLNTPTKVAETDEGVNIYLDEPTQITVREDRHRQKFSRKPLDQLIDSIREVGQLQPGLCRWNEEGRVELLVGERRLRACMVLKKKFLYIIKDELKDMLMLEQAQLDENLIRTDLTWQEEVLAKKRLHEILQERFGKAQTGIRGGHALKDTAEYLGSKIASLSEDVTLATFLSVEEVAAAKNKTTAKKIAKQLIENVKRQEALTIAIKQEEQKSEKARAEKKFKELGSDKAKDLLREGLIKDDRGMLVQLGTESLNKLKHEARGIKSQLIAKGMDEETATDEAIVRASQPILRAEAKRREGIDKLATPEADIIKKNLVYYNKKCILGKMEEKLAEFPDSHFDIVCFDPPWGVEFDKVFKQSGTTKSYEDNADAYFDMLPGWLDQIWQKMAEDSHLYMFFSITNHQFVYDQLSRVGFNHNKMPLIWFKAGAHTTRNPTIWPGRSYEPIAYARKGNKPLQKQGAPDVIKTPMPTPSIKDIHPSAKHPQIYKELLERSATPGEKVLDPMGGSGMFGVAAEALRDNFALDWHMIEMDSDFRNLQLLNLTKGFAKIAGESSEKKSIEVTDMSTVGGFEELTPGTEAWKEWWKAHPEDQTAMLEWRQKTGK